MRLLAIGLLSAIALATGAAGLAPGYSELQYTPPAPGSYQLPRLGPAVDGDVRQANGESTTLHQLLDQKLVLMGFIYTHCPDVNGCPLASYVMKQVQARLADRPELAPQVRLISLSFDPELDTPTAMQQYARHFRRKGYGQFRARYYNEDGSYAGSMSHVLRVYLIDGQKQIRNIYSAAFLHADTVINDIQTLLEAESGRSAPE